MAAIVPSPQQMSLPAGKAREMQFQPLRDVLSGRTRRALRRNGLSDEMNGIYAGERMSKKKAREETIRLKAALEDSLKRLTRLEVWQVPQPERARRSTNGTPRSPCPSASLRRHPRPVP